MIEMGKFCEYRHKEDQEIITWYEKALQYRTKWACFSLGFYYLMKESESYP
jgi:hypothetical protein